MTAEEDTRTGVGWAVQVCLDAHHCFSTFDLTSGRKRYFVSQDDGTVTWDASYNGACGVERDSGLQPRNIIWHEETFGQFIV